MPINKDWLRECQRIMENPTDRLDTDWTEIGRKVAYESLYRRLAPHYFFFLVRQSRYLYLRFSVA